MFKGFLIAIVILAVLAVFLAIRSDWKNKAHKEFRDAFLFSAIIVIARLYTHIVQMRRLLSGIPYEIDYLTFAISISIAGLFIVIPDKNWRVGVIFVVASFVAGGLSKMVSQSSIFGAVLLCLAGIFFLFPASLYFYRLKGKTIVL